MSDKTKRPKSPAYSKKSPVKSTTRNSSLKRSGKPSAGNKNHSSLFSKLLNFFKL